MNNVIELMQRIRPSDMAYNYGSVSTQCQEHQNNTQYEDSIIVRAFNTKKNGNAAFMAFIT